jgi:hypothetical protein
MTEVEEKCGNCRVWFHNNFLGGERRGQCRLHPPTVHPNNSAGSFPLTKETVWCRQWESKVRYVAVDPVPTIDQQEASTEGAWAERERVMRIIEHWYRYSQDQHERSDPRSSSRAVGYGRITLLATIRKQIMDGTTDPST